MRPDQRPWFRLLFWSVIGTGISVIALFTVAERLAAHKPMNENTWIIAVFGVVVTIVGPIAACLAWRRFHRR
jgi:uncharacterized membrane protein YhaH (DUF805 family)